MSSDEETEAHWQQLGTKTGLDERRTRLDPLRLRNRFRPALHVGCRVQLVEGRVLAGRPSR